MTTITPSSHAKLAMLAFVAALGGSLAACDGREPGAADAEQSASAKHSTERMPMAESATAQPSSSKANTTEGTIQKVDHRARTVTIAHGPVPSLDWPAMTMAFQVQDEHTILTLKEGDEVAFSFTSGPENQYVITAISPQR